MYTTSRKATFLLIFMQDPLSLLQLIAEPKAITLKRQDFSQIFVLHCIFLIRGCSMSRGGRHRLIQHPLPGAAFCCLYCPNYCEPAHTYSPQEQFFIVPEIKPSLSYIITIIINGNVPSLQHKQSY